MKAPSIDANILLRAIIRDIPEQSDKVANFIDSNKHIIVSDVAIVETAFALNRYYEIPRKDTAKVLINLLDNPKFKISKEVFASAIYNYAKYPALSIEDCYMAAKAILNDSALYTFDKKLANQIKEAKLL